MLINSSFRIFLFIGVDFFAIIAGIKGVAVGKDKFLNGTFVLASDAYLKIAAVVLRMDKLIKI